MNTGHDLVKRMLADGWRAAVWTGGDEPDYAGTSLRAAWAAVTAVDEARIAFTKAGAARQVALIIPGLEPDETLADHTAGGRIDELLAA